MKYFLTEEQEMMRDLTRQIAEDKIKPIRAECDLTGAFPRDIVKILAEVDLYGMYIPEEYEGMGGGIMDLTIVTEELSRVCAGIGMAFGGTALGTFPIIYYGSDEQKAKYLPKVARGELVGAYAITEPEAGSDAAGIKMTALKDGDQYVLNGTKQFITNGGEADFYTIIAKTDPKRGARGMTAFVVDVDTPGLSFGPKEDKLGIRASATSQVICDEVKVPESAILGSLGKGFMVAMRTFDRTRPWVAAQAVGIAQGAFEESVRYATERKQFGKTIASFQMIQAMLADMAASIEAARLLTYNVARSIDAGDINPKDSGMAKVFASDTAMKVTTDAVQILGGYGYSREYPVEKMMRDAKITQIYEGSNQIQRIVIAERLIRQVASGEL